MPEGPADTPGGAPSGAAREPGGHAGVERQAEGQAREPGLPGSGMHPRPTGQILNLHDAGRQGRDEQGGGRHEGT